MAKAIAAKRRRRRTTARSIRFDDVVADFQRAAAEAPFYWREYPRWIWPSMELPELAPGIDLERLRRFFGRRPIASIDVAAGRTYALHREQAGAAPGTINEELKTLARVLWFAERAGLLRQCPTFAFLRDHASEERRLRQDELRLRELEATRPHGLPKPRGVPFTAMRGVPVGSGSVMFPAVTPARPARPSVATGGKRGAPFKVAPAVVAELLAKSPQMSAGRLAKTLGVTTKTARRYIDADKEARETTTG
jgi:hypothetical protein